MATILEPCEVTLYLGARLPQPEVWAEVLFLAKNFRGRPALACIEEKRMILRKQRNTW